MGPTPLRNFRVPDDIWDAAKARAATENAELSALIRGWLTDYAAGRRRHGPGRPDTVTLSRAEMEKLKTLIDRLLG